MHILELRITAIECPPAYGFSRWFGYKLSDLFCAMRYNEFLNNY